MSIVLLGSGSAEGWPDPFCRCASCTGARAASAAGATRGASGALVDGVLLLDGGPGPGAAATRAGVALTDLAALALTSSPAAGEAGARELQARLPAGRCLLVLSGTNGPSGAYEVGRCTVRVLPAEYPGGAAYDVTTGDGTRLLYAPLGAVPAAPVAYDVVLLGGSDEHVLTRRLASLRASGAVGARTDVVAVSLSHAFPPPPELDRRLRGWGVRAVPDGTELGVRESPALAPRRVLVLGGARSGKSVEAERRLAARPRVTYVATGGAGGDDPDWAARVATHRARRPAGWATVETTDLVSVLAGAATPGYGPLLVDDLSTWLAAVLDESGAWDGSGPRAGSGSALDKVHARVDELVAAWCATPVEVVAVSSEVGAGVVPATASGRLFRDELGRLNARIAEECEEVVLVVAGQVLPLRGAPAG